MTKTETETAVAADDAHDTELNKRELDDVTGGAVKVPDDLKGAKPAVDTF